MWMILLIHFKVLKIPGIKEKTGKTERNCNKEVHLSVNIFLHNLGKIDQAANESYKIIFCSFKWMFSFKY